MERHPFGPDPSRFSDLPPFVADRGLAPAAALLLSPLRREPIDEARAAALADAEAAINTNSFDHARSIVETFEGMADLRSGRGAPRVPLRRLLNPWRNPPHVVKKAAAGYFRAFRLGRAWVPKCTARLGRPDRDRDAQVDAYLVAPFRSFNHLDEAMARLTYAAGVHGTARLAVGAWTERDLVAFVNRACARVAMVAPPGIVGLDTPMPDEKNGFAPMERTRFVALIGALCVAAVAIETLRGRP